MTASERTEQLTARRHAVRLAALSFLVLFVELLLIRWTTAKVIYLSYFTNFVLLGSFLGIGLGFVKRYQALFRFAPLALGVLVAFVYFFPTRLSHSAGSKLLYFGNHTGGIPIWVALPVIFAAVALALMSIAEEAARSFRRLPALRAYRFDLLGSIAGASAFAALSWFETPPIVWGLVASIVLLALLGKRARLLQVAGVVLLLVPLGLEAANTHLAWSPYYEVRTTHVAPRTYLISVNGIPHQATQPLAAAGDYYRAPYRHLVNNPLRNVLVVGAGNGLDVAIALAHGAHHVDAVEIDPRLVRLGRALDPNHPYQSRRVSVHVADGRQFLETTQNRYDLILFALPDSLTLVANQSSLRLESYLFTVEAFEVARARLTSRGAFAMYNFYRQQWLIDRFGRSLLEAFGSHPCLDEQVANGRPASPVADLTVSTSPAALTCAHRWSGSGAPSPATDDHPFPYLESSSVPGFYLWTLAAILGASLLGVRAVAGPLRPIGRYGDLFAMGAAFLLLETKGVVQFALLFGTTWLVNSLVFIGVLLAVLLAVEATARFPLRRPGRLYGLLIASLAVAFAVRPESLLQLGFWPRLACGCALYFTPIFLANVIFTRRFRQAHDPAAAFGANLLGAMVGGTLEYAALLVGYRALLPLVAVLYLLAVVWPQQRLIEHVSPHIPGRRSR